LGGPWLYYSYPFWIVVTLAGMLSAGVFYRLSVSSVSELADETRACFDLYRLRLMTALGRPAPATLADERRQWTELSLLAAYGEDVNFALAASAPKA
jgi:hypothetical protein